MKKAPGRPPEQLEADRILSLPIWAWPDAEDCEIASYDRLLNEAFAREERLFPAQVHALQTYERMHGGLFPIGAGAGKTGAFLMIAEAAFRMKRGRKILWLVPVKLIKTLINRHVPEWRSRVPLSLTFHHFSGRTAFQRMQLAKSGAPGVYILPYSLLSAVDRVELLDTLDPDVVLADEVHHLANLQSACTNCLFSWMRNRKKHPDFVGASGTIFDKSIMEMHHLVDAGLGNGSPLPRSHNLAFLWSTVVDSGSNPAPGLTASTFGPLIAWTRNHFPADEVKKGSEECRRAFRARFTTAPGIVATGDDRPGSSLSIENIDPGEPSEVLVELMDRAKAGETPQGEVIHHAIHSYKWLLELSSGFYNQLEWQSPPQLAEQRGISEIEAGELLERARLHLSVTQDYRKGLREWFEDAPPGLDTPREVGKNIAHHGGRDVGDELAELWRIVKLADFVGRPERIPKPIRICDYKIKASQAWAARLTNESEGGLLWVFHQEMGVWLMEALKAIGIDAMHAPAGAEAELEALGDPRLGGKGNRIVVASMPAHGVGRNLQAFQNQLFVQWPRKARLAEQTLARLHRPGQKADELVAHTMLPATVEFEHVNRGATLVDACCIAELLGAQQRVLYAEYLNAPKIYPPEFLKAQGANPRQMNSAQRDALVNRFGKWTKSA